MKKAEPTGRRGRRRSRTRCCLCCCLCAILPRCTALSLVLTALHATSAIFLVVWHSAANRVIALSLAGVSALFALLSLLYFVGILRRSMCLVLPLLTAKLIVIVNTGLMVLCAWVAAILALFDLVIYKSPLAFVDTKYFYVCFASLLTILFGVTTKVFLVLYAGFLEIDKMYREEEDAIAEAIQDPEKATATCLCRPPENGTGKNGNGGRRSFDAGGALKADLDRTTAIVGRRSIDMQNVHPSPPQPAPRTKVVQKPSAVAENHQPKRHHHHKPHHRPDNVPVIDVSQSHSSSSAVVWQLRSSHVPPRDLLIPRAATPDQDLLDDEDDDLDRFLLSPTTDSRLSGYSGDERRASNSNQHHTRRHTSNSPTRV